MLSTCLIVKNEFKNLKELLPQLKEFSDEIVVVDTGSTDGSYEFLKKNTNIKQYKIEWEDDFSKARNFSIKKATKDFILWIDADDRIDDTRNFLKIKKNLSYNSIYAIKILNSNDNSFFYQLRIFPNRKDIKFYGKVHEQLIFNKEKYKVKYLDVKIIHKGYENRENLIKKHERNIKILEKIENKSFYDYFQLAQSYKIIGNYKKAYNLFKKAISLENLEIFCEIHYELYKISTILNEKNPEKFLFKALDYGEFFPPIFYHIARYFYSNGNFEKAIYFFEKFLNFHKNHKYFNPVSVKLENSARYFLEKAKSMVRIKDEKQQ